ncbi:MAG: hypothetical protein SGI92_24560 [Bryobacteraceae bacterium]|nr:hypothetical protein [Bryobacteraceae bacterium]
MMPFAHNESTRYISPTKTPEYLAAGKPVVSTSITDVVRPYGTQRLVRIADSPEAFALEIDNAMAVDANDPAWAERRDLFLATNSWDITFRRMRELMENRVFAKAINRMPAGGSTVRPLETAALGD